MDVFGVTTRPEMEFLDLNLTPDSSLLLHAVQSLLLADFKEHHTLLLFKNPDKKIREILIKVNKHKIGSGIRSLEKF